MILIDCLIFAVDGGLWSSCSVELMLKVTILHITVEEYVYQQYNRWKMLDIAEMKKQ
jgi:hypothetical protein